VGRPEILTESGHFDFLEKHLYYSKLNNNLELLRINDTKGFRANFLRVLIMLEKLHFFPGFSRENIYRVFSFFLNLNINNADQEVKGVLKSKLDTNLKIFNKMTDKMKNTKILTAKKLQFH